MTRYDKIPKDANGVGFPDDDSGRHCAGESEATPTVTVTRTVWVTSNQHERERTTWLWPRPDHVILRLSDWTLPSRPDSGSEEPQRSTSGWAGAQISKIFLISDRLENRDPAVENLGNEKVKLFQSAPISTIFGALERYVHGHYTSDRFKSRNCHLGLEFLTLNHYLFRVDRA